MKTTFELWEERFLKNNFDWRESFYEEDYQDSKIGFTGIINDLRFEVVDNLTKLENDSYGNSNDIYSIICKFNEQGEEIFIQFNGFYQSYNGTEWVDYKQVTPQQKTITVWN